MAAMTAIPVGGTTPCFGGWPPPAVINRRLVARLVKAPRSRHGRPRHGEIAWALSQG